MKTVMVMYEGAADVPLDSLEGRTPLQVARNAHANRLAEQGRCGLLASVRDGLDGRSEVLLAVLCGLPVDDALRLSRGALEAATLEMGSAACHFAYRGNLVTMDDGRLTASLAASITEEETASLAASLQAQWDPAEVRFVVSGPARLLVLIGREEPRLAPGYPPSLMEGERTASFLPRGKEGELAREVMERAESVLSSHPVNEVRVDLGENPANGLWLWGGGTFLPPGALRREGAASMLSPCRMAEGLARLSGMKMLAVDLARLGTSSEAAFRVAPLVEALQESDRLIVYITAPAELGRYGGGTEKVRMLERYDQQILGPLLSVLEAYRPYRILLAPDGVVSSRDNHPTSGNVPLVLAGEGVAGDEVRRWDEEACAVGALGTVRPAQALNLLAGV